MAIITRDLQPGEMPVTVAKPTDSYARPQQREGRSMMGEFLSALGKLEPAVMGLAQTIDKQQGDKAEEAANLKAIQTDPKELRSEIESGNYFGLGHRRAQRALSVMDAQNRAFEIGAELDAKQQRGELSGVEPSQVFGQVVQPHASSIKDPLAAKAFNQVIQPTLRKFQLEQTRTAIKSDMEDKEGQLFRYMTNLHDQVTKDGGSAEQHRAAMLKVADFAKNDLLIGNDQSEKVMARAAQHYAMKGNKGLVEVFGDYDRNGARLRDRYGPTFDSWAKQAEAVGDRNIKEATQKDADLMGARMLKGEERPEDFNEAVDALQKRDPDNFGATRAEQMKIQYQQNLKGRIERQQKIVVEQQKQHVENQFIDAGADRMMEGKGYQLEEEVRYTAGDGKQQVLSKKDYQTRMYEGAERKLQKRAENEGWDQDKLEGERTRLYGRNGETRPVLQRSFNDLFMGSKAGAPPQGTALQERLNHLEHLRAADPSQYLAMGGGKKERDSWLQAYAAGREFGMEPERAYATANARIFQGTGLERYTPTEKEDVIQKTLKQFQGSGVMGGIFARERAVQAVETAIAGGWDSAKIPEKALELLNKSHLVVNGLPVRNALPGIADRTTAEEYFKDASRFFKDGNPTLKTQNFPIAITDDPSQTGRYIFVRTDTMERLSKPGQSVSSEELKKYVVQWRENSRTKAAADREALIQNPDDSPYTRAVEEKARKRKARQLNQ